jgi:voltage-gated potassium channel
MNDIIYLTMRRLRTPLIVLLIVYFLSVTVMVTVPGVDPEGNVVRPSFLDAAYFVAILSTTIGFGEIPFPFTDAQRLIVFFIIFPNVIAWLYAIGVILGLFLDPQFKAMLAHNRFRRRVSWTKEPFFLMCGFGRTGGMLAQGLLNRGLQVIAVDQDEHTLLARLLDERDRYSHVPMLASDTANQETLELAGLSKPNCSGVIAVTNDSHTNLTVAITVKLLKPGLPVFARSQDQRTSDNMASFGTDHVVDPYEIFSRRLALAFSSTTKYLVQDWLISVPGSKLREPLVPPKGRWVICGMGRFGRRMAEALDEAQLPWTAVDVHPERIEALEGGVLGRGTEAETLEAAEIRDAVGIIAGTGDDMDNLSIVMTARHLNPDLFVVARQEHQQNEELFEASGADLVARPSLIVARRILALATTPLIKTFLDHLERESEDFANRLKRRLERCLGAHAPSVWVTELVGEKAQSLRAAREENVVLELDHLLHNTRVGEDESLRCVCLVHERGAQRIFMPTPDTELKEGDRLLFAGRGSARREIARALADPVQLFDYATPYRVPRTAIGRWWVRRNGAWLSRS